MKRSTFIVLVQLFVILVAAAFSGAFGQTVAKLDASGNYVAVASAGRGAAAESTGKTFTDTDGKKYEVFRGARGGLFYWHVPTKGKNAGVKVKRYIKQQ